MEAGSLRIFKALRATQTNTEVFLKSMIVIPQFLPGAFISCEKRNSATAAFNVMSDMGVQYAALVLVSSRDNLSLTHCTYTLQF
jgi:hypothetical protein